MSIPYVCQEKTKAAVLLIDHQAGRPGSNDSGRSAASDLVRHRLRAASRLAQRHRGVGYPFFEPHPRQPQPHHQRHQGQGDVALHAGRVVALRIEVHNPTEK